MSDHRSRITDHFAQLCDIVAKLRAPDGCPWDREQTNTTLASKLLEEAYEVVHSIQENDDANLREELGDVLLLVVMHAEIAREGGRFDIDQIAHEVTEKLIRRHPHVFGAAEVKDSAGVLRQWEEIKHGEKRKRFYLEGVAAAMPALLRAEKIQKKAARVNFDWRELRDVIAKVDEELAETKAAIDRANETQIADELGDLLFAVVNLARKCNLEAEALLQSAIDKFISRFNQMEDRLRQRGGNLGEATLEELDGIWNEIKTKHVLS